MDIKIEKLAQSKIKITVSYTADEFKPYYDKALSQELENVEMKGFRKGHAPESLYLREYGEGRVLTNASDHAINNGYYKAIMDNKINVVADPEIDVDFETLAKTKALTFTATVAVYPEVVVKDYFGVEVEKMPESASEEDVNAAIERERANKADLVLVEGEAVLEAGETATFDFEGFMDGKAFPGGSAKDYKLEIGSQQFIPGFEEQMLGMKAGETKTITVAFPEDYGARDLAGKNADFKITLHKIERKIVPALDDDFAKSTEREGVTDVESYKAAVKAELDKQKKRASDNKFTDDVIRTVAHLSEVELPEALLTQRKSRMIEQMKQQASMYGLSYEQFLKIQGVDQTAYEASLAESAKESVLEEVVLHQVMVNEKIELSEEEIEDQYKEIAAEDNKSVEDEKKAYPLENIMDYFLMVKTRRTVVAKAIANTSAPTSAKETKDASPKKKTVKTAAKKATSATDTEKD